MRRRPLLVLLLVTLLAGGVGVRDASVGRVLRLAAPHVFSLIGWEVTTFPEKWLQDPSLPWAGRPTPSSPTGLARFFALGQCLGTLEERIGQQAALGNSTATARLQAERREVLAEWEALRGGVERRLEGAVSAAIRDVGLTMRPLGLARLQFPPVDLRFAPQPRLLVLSPRDRIQQVSTLLLDPSMTVSDMEALEGAVRSELDLSALVVQPGGIAAYPAVVPRDLRRDRTVMLSAHEWMHHYLWFHPLGRAYFQEPGLVPVNETLADVAGREIGARVLPLLTAEMEPAPTGEETAAPGSGPSSAPTKCPGSDEQAGRDGRRPGQAPGETGLEPGAAGERPAEKAFEFAREMRKTRLRVEHLLGQGGVAEAEAYMEARRLEFVEHGFPIRKLNQAYFAFHQSYAGSPASTSPVDSQLRALRGRLGTLKAVVEAVAAVGTYAEYRALLERHGIRPEPTPPPPGSGAAPGPTRLPAPLSLSTGPECRGPPAAPPCSPGAGVPSPGSATGGAPVASP